jgi:hypothetical protein
MKLEDEAKSILVRHGYGERELRCQKLKPFRSRVFRGDVADFILKHRTNSVIFAEKVPSLSRQALQLIREYKEKHHPELEWLLWDEKGGYEFEVAGEVVCGTKTELHSPRTPGARQETPSLHSFFSPINQWLLKVLLLRGMEEEYWSGPQEFVSSVGDLVRLAGVSVGTASKFLNRGRALGYLGEDRHTASLVVLRREQLLEDWAHALRFRQNDFEVYPLTCLYGEPQEEVIKRVLALEPKDSFHIVLGAFWSTEHCGWQSANVGKYELYLQGDLAEFLEEAQLLLTDSPASKSLYVKMPRNPAPIFRGAGCARGVPICDPLQWFLDLRHEEPRGTEQSQRIYQGLLRKLWETQR